MTKNRAELIGTCAMSAMVLSTKDGGAKLHAFVEDLKRYVVDQVEGGKDAFIATYGQEDYDLLQSIGRPELYSNPKNALDHSRVRVEEMALFFFLLNIEQPVQYFFVPLDENSPSCTVRSAFGEFIMQHLDGIVKKFLYGRGAAANISNFATMCASKWFEIRGFAPYKQ